MAYAEECDPDTNDDWFEIKRRTFGGDDGVDFLDAEGLEVLMSSVSDGTHLRIAFSDETLELSVISRG